MNLNDILKWISMNGFAAFLIGCFLCTIAGIVGNTVIGVARTLTGRFPAPSPVIKCDGNCNCNSPCKCCSENGCQVGCECASEVEE